MKISYNWLKEYLDILLSPEETAERLTLLGLEVEEIINTGSDFPGFVVGEILSVASHPNADKLVLCSVNTGNEQVQIVCGAKNVAAGQKVPVATVGSVLPVPSAEGKYLTIKKAKLRGEVSSGMICSEAELGISDQHAGIMVLDPAIEPGTPLKKVLGTEPDTVFEIGLTPNRPDAACHIGVARDLSAVIQKPLRYPDTLNLKPVKKSLEGRIEIAIEDEDKCHRYTGIMVEGVTIKESPVWLKNRLKAIGLRPINNIVDVTNFVLHETGQPLHAFDYDVLGGKKIIVKSFDKEISFATLDSVERKVPAGSLFICDGNGPVAIAGVMGGENSEVTSRTKNILIESAWFNPASIRKTSKALALQTDSSYRFERGIDPGLQLRAGMRAASLIAELAGGTIVKGYEDVHPVKTEPVTISLRISRMNRLLGTRITREKARAILNALEIKTSEKDVDILECTVPAFRPDITREVDLIEETGRIFDFNNIPRPDSAPFIVPETLSELEQFHQQMRHTARSLAYKEISTNSLLSKKEALLLSDESSHIDTLNPVSMENTTLRTHLLGGFLKAVRYNLNRNATNLRFFELGHTFRKSSRGTWIDGVQEHIVLLLGVSGLKKNEDWQGTAVPYSIFDLKADIEALLSVRNIAGKTHQSNETSNRLAYLIDNREVASLFRVDDDILKGYDVEQEVFAAEIDLTVLYELGAVNTNLTYQPVPKYPPFEFDAAFTVDREVSTGKLTEIIRKTAGNILYSVSVFDVYEGKNIGENKKSIAFRLTFLDSNKTLNIKDVEPVVQKVVQSLEKNLGAKLRS